jgi:hypothetical protein
MTVLSGLDAAGRRRSPATLPRYHAGRAPRNNCMVAVGTGLRLWARPAPAQIPACTASALGSWLGPDVESRVGPGMRAPWPANQSRRSSRPRTVVGNSAMCCSRRSRPSGTRAHAVTCALWTSSAAGRSTIVCTARLLAVDRMTAAQGPQRQTNLTVVLAAHSAAPGRPRTPDSNRLTGAKAKDRRYRRRPFSRPRRERDSAQRTHCDSDGA